MRVDTFSYDLPPERIAQHPTEDREAARLMVLPSPDDADGGCSIEHSHIRELASLIPSGALVVLNDTRVIRARLLGKKPETGGKVEIFLVRRLGTRSLEVAPGDVREVDVWRALGKASKALKFGSDVHVTAVDLADAARRALTVNGVAGLSPSRASELENVTDNLVPRRGPQLIVRLLGRAEDDGLLEVALYVPGGGVPIDEAIRAVGHVPLPPYIKRDDHGADTERYQTVFSRVEGAVAAPTAGLHLTRGLLGRLAIRECPIATVTLHVGLGTFQPVTVDDLDQHPMHAERFEVTRTTARAIAEARDRGAPVVAIGTTVVRALESAADPDREGYVLPMSGDTRLLIQPGYRFRVVDQLVTNFHLPKSTLLAMVCAFGGTERVLSAYETAVRENYRFFSYGDAMLLRRFTA